MLSEGVQMSPIIINEENFILFQCNLTYASGDGIWIESLL